MTFETSTNGLILKECLKEKEKNAGKQEQQGKRRIFKGQGIVQLGGRRRYLVLGLATRDKQVQQREKFNKTLYTKYNSI